MIKTNLDAKALLEVNNLQAAYGNLQVLWDVSFSVYQGEFVALIGPNGAGKTTTLRAISGVIKPTSGKVYFMGKSITKKPGYQISRARLGYITENLNLFQAMSVKDNLLLGAYYLRDSKKVKASLDLVFELFPILSERRDQLAGTLSGGERRMLALGRGLMSEPHLLMVDEPSLGLAPKLVRTVFDALKELHGQGLTLLLVEQNVNQTLSISDRAYVLEQGRIIKDGPSAELLQDEYLRETYLGQR